MILQKHNPFVYINYQGDCVCVIIDNIFVFN